MLKTGAVVTCSARPAGERGRIVLLSAEYPPPVGGTPGALTMTGPEAEKLAAMVARVATGRFGASIADLDAVDPDREREPAITPFHRAAYGVGLAGKLHEETGHPDAARLERHLADLAETLAGTYRPPTTMTEGPGKR